MRAVLVFIFATLTFPVFADSPEEVIAKYLTAISNEDLDDIGLLIHPEAIPPFRAIVEPFIQKLIRSRSSRQMFGAFIDPYEPKTIKSMTDVEFMSAFARWIQTWRQESFDMLSKTEFTVLGHVPDGDKNLVIIRLNADFKGKAWETLIIRTTKEYEGTQLMTVPTEFINAADTLRGQR